MKTKKPTLNDLIGKPINRDEAYMMRLFDKALSEDIKKDVIVEFGSFHNLAAKYGNAYYGAYADEKKNIPPTANMSKVKAYCRIVNSYLQFPRELRKPGDRYLSDIVSTENDKVGGFWRVIKGTIRKEGSDKVVA